MKFSALTKKVPLLLIAVLILTVCFSLGSMAMSNGTAFASAELVVGSSETITIAQISDVHYFPLENSYIYTRNPDGSFNGYVNSEDYLNSAFNDATYGDTKLVAESGAILNAIIQSFIASAKEKANNYETALSSGENIDAALQDLDTVPDYLLLTGDLTKNAERVSLVDVANAFRYLQNEVREIKYLDGATEKYPFANFQIFAVPGNHDLYNSSSKIYDNGIDGDGSAIQTDTVNAALFAMIFAGLGFPDVDVDIMNNVLCQKVSYQDGALTYDTGRNLEYWYGDFTGSYVYSSNAKNIKVDYFNEALQNLHEIDSADYTDPNEYMQAILNYYAEIGESFNVLSYVVEVLTGEEGQPGTESAGYSIIMCDASDRTYTETTVPIMASAQQIAEAVNLYKFNETNGKYDSIEDYNISLIRKELAAGKELYFNSGLEHTTGGKVSVPFLNWLDNEIVNAGTLKSNASGFDGTEETILFAVHQNVLPHFDKEDDLLKDFTLYNWEYVTKRLINMGVRYTFSGHMHANDIASYTDAIGNVLYDFQTGSTVSYSAPTRHIEITRDYYFDDNHFIAEHFESSILELGSLRESQSSNIINPVAWNDISTDGMTALEKALARRETNPDYALYAYYYDEFNSSSFNEFIDDIIYDNLTTRMLDHFLNVGTVNSLKDALGTFFDGTFRTMLGSIFEPYADITHELALSMVDQVLDDMTYTYGGQDFVSNPDKSNPALIQMLRAICDNALDMEFGVEGNIHTLREMVSLIMKNHINGTEFKSLEEVINITAPIEGASEEEFARYYYGCALKQIIEDSESGDLVRDLLEMLLDPLILDETSLIKTLLSYKFDFSDIGLTDEQKDNANSLFKVAISALNGLIDKDSPQLTEDMLSLENFCLGDILDSAKGFLNSFLSKSFGISLGDMTVVEFAEDFIDKYMVESFFVGTGGLVKDIVVAFGTDTVQDIADSGDLSEPYFLRFAKDYKVDPNYAVIQNAEPVVYTYVQGQFVSRTFNAATTENGRLPSKITANFDTVDPTTSFTFSYYTDEDVFTRFEILDDANNVIAAIETTPSSAIVYDKRYTAPDELGWETRNGEIIKGDWDLALTTTTMPAYVPLIDLGLLCLTHTEVTYEVDDEEYYYSADMRDGDLTVGSYLHINNYVVYKNRHTIKISDLDAGTTYRYRVYGTYENQVYNKTAEFSLTENYNKQYFTFKTAEPKDVDKFEFLAIADLQASILDSYKRSAAVLDYIAEDDSLNNYDFILNGGDMVDNGKNFYQWGWALDSMAEHFANTTMFMSAGNHEDHNDAYNNYFNYTLEDGVNSEQNTDVGAYFSVDYGTLHFVVLNTNDISNKGLGKEQIDWLKADLAANESKWTVVLMHKGIYSPGSHSTDADIVAMRSQLTSVFAEGGVDIVLSGHDHTYSTTKIVDKDGNAVENALDSNGNVVNNDIGVIYLTLGTLGEKFYEYVENENVTPKFDLSNTYEKMLTGPTFAHFSIDGDNLVIKNYIYLSNNDISTIQPITENGGLIKITKKFGTAGTAVDGATVNDTKLVFGQDIKVGFFSLNNVLNIDMSNFPEGSTIQLFSNGKAVDALNMGFFAGRQEFEVRLLDKDGNYATLGVISLVRDGFVLYTILMFCGIAVVVAGIAVAVLLSIKKKKSGANPDGDGGDDNDTLDETKTETTVSNSKKDVDLDEVKKEITTDIDASVEKSTNADKVKAEAKVEVKKEEVADAKTATKKQPTTAKTADAKPKATPAKATTAKPATATKTADAKPKATTAKATTTKATTTKTADAKPKATTAKASTAKPATAKSTATKAKPKTEDK